MSRRRSDEVIASADEVTIGELVRLTGLRYSTLKHYTEIGLLPFSQAESNLTRRYHRVATTKRLEEIRRRRAEGQSLEEISQFFSAN